MLPLSLLKAAENNPMLIELKNGDTYNGRLVSCNTFMNIHLRDVICTSRDGDRFWKIPECYIRGNSIKYLRIPEDVIERVPDDERDSKYRLPHNFILIFSALVSSTYFLHLNYRKALKLSLEFCQMDYAYFSFFTAQKKRVAEELEADD